MKRSSLCEVMAIREKLMTDNLAIDFLSETSKGQFRSCNAWKLSYTVTNIKTGEVYENCQALQSYSTLVAIVVNGTLYRLGCSQSTKRQITIWKRDIKGIKHENY